MNNSELMSAISTEPRLRERVISLLAKRGWERLTAGTAEPHDVQNAQRPDQADVEKFIWAVATNATVLITVSSIVDEQATIGGHEIGVVGTVAHAVDAIPDADLEYIVYTQAWPSVYPPPGE